MKIYIVFQDSRENHHDYPNKGIVYIGTNIGKAHIEAHNYIVKHNSLTEYDDAEVPLIDINEVPKRNFVNKEEYDNWRKNRSIDWVIDRLNLYTFDIPEILEFEL